MNKEILKEFLGLVTEDYAPFKKGDVRYFTQYQDEETFVYCGDNKVPLDKLEIIYTIPRE